MSRFDAACEGTPPWAIGSPQPAVVRLADAGAFRGAVLDAGCGTGENALLLAEAQEEVRSEGGPRPFTQWELREAFRDGWSIASVEPDRFASRIHPRGARAWRAHLVRAGGT